MKKTILLGVVFFTFTLNVFSQKLSHEFGVIVGPISMQTDYGERHDFPSSFGNVGFGAGIVYYLSFNADRIRWNDRGSFLKNHSKIRAEVSYMSDNFIQRGRYIESNSTQSILLKNIHGSTKMYNFGAQFQFSIFSSSDFRALEPYVSIGGLYSIFKPEVVSNLGNLEEDPSLIPTAYRGGIFTEKDATGSLIFGGGTTYTTKNNFKMVFDFRWQRFLSNRVDGLEPQIDADKYREWLIFLNVGAVFKLN